MKSLKARPCLRLKFVESVMQFSEMAKNKIQKHNKQMPYLENRIYISMISKQNDATKRKNEKNERNKWNNTKGKHPQIDRKH